MKIDCLIISTGRAASTSIYKYIGQAGRLNLPQNKEPHYWCDIHKFKGLYPSLNRIHIKDDDEYYRLYAKADLKIDASVGYFFYITDVINRLSAADQMPKIIFLYREPVSRAYSLFNELKKKNLTNKETIEEDIANTKNPGMWWEHYYDNVNYFTNYIEMEKYFNEILAINYDYFSKNQISVLSNILHFLSIGPENIKDVDLFAHNSSVSALLHHKHRKLSRLSKFMPRFVTNIVKPALAKRHLSVNRNRKDAIIPYLKNSITEYEKFRRHINYEDVLWLKK